MTEENDAPDEEALRQIAAMSGVEIPEGEYDDQLERLRERLAATRRWREERDLGFTFEDGFDYVPPAHLHRHRWDVPTPTNAREEDADGEGDGGSLLGGGDG